MKVVWMFSGQGSQYFNMGRDLYDKLPLFREEMQQCEAAFKELTGRSLLEQIFPGTSLQRSPEFTEITFTHPGLFCLQFALAQTVLRIGFRPDLILGYSLGEIVAHTIAGGVDFKPALQAVIHQATLLKELAPPGAMLAVLASTEIIRANPTAFRDVSVAAENFNGHFVLSGIPEAIRSVSEHLRSNQVAHQLLPVGFGFHSAMIEPIEQPLKAKLLGLRKRPLDVPVLSTSLCRQVSEFCPDLIWEVVRKPVRLQETVATIPNPTEFVYLDLGPSGTMATFLKYLLPRDKTPAIYTIITPYNRAVENLAKVESALLNRSERP
jgi:acyl transferase domain-containing protein